MSERESRSGSLPGSASDDEVTIAILPAAGRSSRMGRPKLLLPFGRSTVVGSLVASLCAAGVDRIVLVTAPGADTLSTWGRDNGLDVAVNEEPGRGMLSSILVGVDFVEKLLGGTERLLAEEVARPVLVCPADMPAVAPATIRRIVEAQRASDAPLALPSYDGRRGHPLALAPSLLPRLRELDVNVGLKAILEGDTAVLEVDVGDEGAVRDVDTPDEYESLRARAE